MVQRQANPVLDKMGRRLLLAGAGIQGPILAGLAGRLTVTFEDEETLEELRIEGETGFLHGLTVNQDTEGKSATADLIFGTDTDTSVAGRRNFVVFTTERGTQRRQFWVKNKPTSGGVYIDNQEAQQMEAIVYVNIGDLNPWARSASVAFNLLPTFNDEFFNQQEYSGNRYANTRRNWGGVETCQTCLSDDPAAIGDEIIAESKVEDVMGYFWEPENYGLYYVTFRLRARKGSSTYVDIVGKMRARQIPCS